MTPGSAELWRAGVALGMLALVAWVPGLALHRLLAPQRSRAEAVAVAPALSAGLLYVLGQLLTLVDLAVDARVALVLGGAGLGVLLWCRRGNGRVLAVDRLARNAVLLGVGLGTVVWTLGVQRLNAVAPHNDGYNHGLFIRRILQARTLEPRDVMPHDVLLGGHGVDFYPLALHQQAAALVQVLHLDVAAAWTLTSLSLTVLALPLGMLALGRRLFPDLPRVASASAVLAALVPGLTYSTAWWGGYALAAGFAILPGALLLTLDATDRGAPRAVAAAAVALAGTAGVHTSESSLLCVLAAVLVLTSAVQRRSVVEALRRGARLGAVVTGSLLLLSPALAQLQRGLDERAYPVADHGVAVTTAVRQVVVVFSFVPPVTPTALVLAFWLGLGMCLAQRRASGWVACWGLFAVLYVWLAAHPSELVTMLTATWYADLFRLGYILAFLSVPFLGLAVAGTLGARRREVRPVGPVLGLVMLVTACTASVQAIREDYEDFALVGPDERAAFAFLADRVGPEEHVVNQHQDGSPWMYSLYGVAPVFALKTFDFARPEWRDATYLARNVQAAGADPEVDRLLTAFRARFVYVGPEVFPTEGPDLDRAALGRSPALRLVFARGNTQVYEVIR